MEPIRLQKILSRAGFGSRRDGEKLIAENRVTINGRTASLGDKTYPENDVIEVDGRIIKYQRQEKIYIAFNKPKNVLSDINKTDNRKFVTDFIPLDDYVFIVGRLDYDSEGLILLTNDGVLANHLTHPRFEHEKEYEIETMSTPDEDQLKKWRRGVMLPNGYRTLPAKVSRIKSRSNNWLRVILRGGKKRQIREVGKTIGLPIRRIIRKRIGGISLQDLRPGEWRYISEDEIKKSE